MKRIFAGSVMAMVALAPLGAAAQERSGDAALGALSGAVVLGPVGAVAGAIVGYTAGPSIARSWRLRRPKPIRHVRRAKVSAPRTAVVGAPPAGPPAQSARVNQVPPNAPSTPPAQTLE